MFDKRGRFALGLSCIFAFETISTVDVNAQGPLSLRPTPQESSPPTSSINPGTTNPLNRTPAASARTGSAISSRNLLGGSSRSASSRVARAPNMFGDTLPPLISFRTQGGQGSADFPRDVYQAPLGGEAVTTSPRTIRRYLSIGFTLSITVFSTRFHRPVGLVPRRFSRLICIVMLPVWKRPFSMATCRSMFACPC